MEDRVGRPSQFREIAHDLALSGSRSTVHASDPQAMKQPDFQLGLIVLKCIDHADQAERPGERLPLEVQSAQIDRLGGTELHPSAPRPATHGPALRKRD